MPTPRTASAIAAARLRCGGPSSGVLGDVFGAGRLSLPNVGLLGGLWCLPWSSIANPPNANNQLRANPGKLSETADNATLSV